MERVYLALGSNVGDRLQNLKAAVEQLQAQVTVEHVSDVFETEPWGVVEQPKFLNCAVSGTTMLEPHKLLDFVKGVERALGRTETVRYGPRVIDVDILLYDELIARDASLEIPHPRMAERRFVLVPLTQIAPDAQHPLRKTTVSALLAQLPDEGDIQFYAVWENGDAQGRASQ